MMIDFRNEYKKLLKKRKNQNKNFLVKKKFDMISISYLVNNDDVVNLLYILDTNL